MDELKLILEEDDYQNKNGLEVKNRGFYEEKISNFEENFTDDENIGKIGNFELCGHFWCTQYSYHENEDNYFEINFQNLDTQIEDKNDLIKFVISFKDSENSTRYKSYISSLCFFKDVNINRSEGYSNFIVKEDYDENIKVLIKNNDIMINIYLCIYESNKDLYNEYFNKFKNQICKNEKYEIQEEIIYEFAVDYWNKNRNLLFSPYFKIENYTW
ncbi:hypothetical protein U3516DRAFT_671015 [Neocallimastix sp. 'constans']